MRVAEHNDIERFVIEGKQSDLFKLYFGALKDFSSVMVRREIKQETKAFRRG